MIGRVMLLLGAIGWLIMLVRAVTADNELFVATATVCANVYVVGYVLAAKIEGR